MDFQENPQPGQAQTGAQWGSIMEGWFSANPPVGQGQAHGQRVDSKHPPLLYLYLYSRGGCGGEMSAQIGLGNGLADDGKRFGLSESALDVAFPQGLL